MTIQVSEIDCLVIWSPSYTRRILFCTGLQLRGLPSTISVNRSMVQPCSSQCKSPETFSGSVSGLGSSHDRIIAAHSEIDTGENIC